MDASGVEAKAHAETPATETKELTKAERKALFEQQNKAKIEAVKAAKEKEKLSKAERAAIQESQRAQKAQGGAHAKERHGCAPRIVDDHVSEAARHGAGGREEERDRERLQLLQIGTVVEVQERAARARGEKSQKGRQARDAHEALQITGAGGFHAPDSCAYVDLRGAINDAIAASSYHNAGRWCAEGIPPAQFAGSEEVQVWNATVLSATQELAARNLVPGALNFASARNPGGGFTTGASAQEESIARSSALYPCLTKHFDSFFVPSRRARSGAYTHDMILSPRVPVFRNDAGRLLETPYLVDFLTAAAPNVGAMRQEYGANAAAEAELVLRERITRVLSLFAKAGCAELVLGAWGCGVFGNSPEIVARFFCQELRGRFRGQFRLVIFAVLDPDMAEVFGHTFGVPVAPHSFQALKCN